MRSLSFLHLPTPYFLAFLYYSLLTQPCVDIIDFTLEGEKLPVNFFYNVAHGGEIDNMAFHVGHDRADESWKKK